MLEQSQWMSEMGGSEIRTPITGRDVLTERQTSSIFSPMKSCLLTNVFRESFSTQPYPMNAFVF
jgi:hypothetical protein